MDNTADGGQDCHLAIPSNVQDRPPTQVTDIHSIDSLTSEPITFELDRKTKIFDAGTRLILRCQRVPAPPGGDAGIDGFLYYP